MPLDSNATKAEPPPHKFHAIAVPKVNLPSNVLHPPGPSACKRPTASLTEPHPTFETPSSTPDHLLFTQVLTDDAIKAKWQREALSNNLQIQRGDACETPSPNLTKAHSISDSQGSTPGQLPRAESLTEHAIVQAVQETIDTMKNTEQKVAPNAPRIHLRSRPAPSPPPNDSHVETRGAASSQKNTPHAQTSQSRLSEVNRANTRTPTGAMPRRGQPAAESNPETPNQTLRSRPCTRSTPTPTVTQTARVSNAIEGKERSKSNEHDDDSPPVPSRTPQIPTEVSSPLSRSPNSNDAPDMPMVKRTQAPRVETRNSSTDRAGPSTRRSEPLNTSRSNRTVRNQDVTGGMEAESIAPHHRDTRRELQYPKTRTSSTPPATYLPSRPGTGTSSSRNMRPRTPGTAPPPRAGLSRRNLSSAQPKPPSTNSGADSGLSGDLPMAVTRAGTKSPTLSAQVPNKRTNRNISSNVTKRPTKSRRGRGRKASLKYTTIALPGSGRAETPDPPPKRAEKELKRKPLRILSDDEDEDVVEQKNELKKTSVITQKAKSTVADAPLRRSSRGNGLENAGSRQQSRSEQKGVRRSSRSGTGSSVLRTPDSGPSPPPLTARERQIHGLAERKRGQKRRSESLKPEPKARKQKEQSVAQDNMDDRYSGIHRLDLQAPSDSDSDSSDDFESPQVKKARRGRRGASHRVVASSGKKTRNLREEHMGVDPPSESKSSGAKTPLTPQSAQRKSQRARPKVDYKDAWEEEGLSDLEDKTDSRCQTPVQGSQGSNGTPMKLKVESISSRKKQKKEFPERLFTQMESEELSILRIAFTEYYEPPPSNMQAHARIEMMYGIELNQAAREDLWKTDLKPWSDRWWQLYGEFNDLAREKKKQKPRTKKPTVCMSEAKIWAKAFFDKNGKIGPKFDKNGVRASGKSGV